jgi:hypothetical protein
MNKRVALVALVIGLLMIMQPNTAFAAQAFTSVTCADPEGNQVTRVIGWDNSNVYFNGKGDIPRLYCEGGHAGIYNTYISDTLEANSPLRYFNGIIPTPSPTPEPTPSQTETTPTPTPEPTSEPTETPTQTPTPEPSASPEPTLEPTTEPTASPEPSASPTLEPTTEPTPEVTPEPTPSPTEIQIATPTPEPTPTQEQPTEAPVVPLEPTLEPTPTPTEEPTLEPTPEATSLPAPSVNPEVQTIELPENLQVIGVIQLAAAAEAIMNVGADMTEEEREESQIIAVAAIIISQIAGSIRRATK